MIDLMSVKNLDEYYKKLNKSIPMSKMWNTLESKAEYATNKNEMVYQLFAKKMARDIARKLKANSDIAEILTMCKGSYFPVCGKEGKKVIVQYLKDRNIEISEAELARKFVEYNLSKSDNIITPEFDKLLQELFDDEKNATTLEVQIANVCQATVNDVKRIPDMPNISKADLLYKISKDAEQTSEKLGVPSQSEKAKEMVKCIPENKQKMGDFEKQRMYSDLDMFSKFYDGQIEGICEYIGTDDLRDIER